MCFGTIYLLFIYNLSFSFLIFHWPFLYACFKSYKYWFLSSFFPFDLSFFFLPFVFRSFSPVYFIYWCFAIFLSPIFGLANPHVCLPAVYRCIFATRTERSARRMVGPGRPKNVRHWKIWGGASFIVGFFRVYVFVYILYAQFSGFPVCISSTCDEKAASALFRWHFWSPTACPVVFTTRSQPQLGL